MNARFLAMRRECKAERASARPRGRSTRRRPSAEGAPGGLRSALARSSAWPPTAKHAIKGEPETVERSWTARRPGADLATGGRKSHGPEALGQMQTAGHRPGPPLPARRRMGRAASPQDRDTIGGAPEVGICPSARGAAGRWCTSTKIRIGRPAR